MCYQLENIYGAKMKNELIITNNMIEQYDRNRYPVAFRINEYFGIIINEKMVYFARAATFSPAF